MQITGAMKRNGKMGYCRLNHQILKLYFIEHCHLRNLLFLPQQNRSLKFRYHDIVVFQQVIFLFRKL